MAAAAAPLLTRTLTAVQRTLAAQDTPRERKADYIDLGLDGISATRARTLRRTLLLANQPGGHASVLEMLRDAESALNNQTDRTLTVADLGPRIAHWQKEGSLFVSTPFEIDGARFVWTAPSLQPNSVVTARLHFVRDDDDVTAEDTGAPARDEAGSVEPEREAIENLNQALCNMRIDHFFCGTRVSGLALATQLCPACNHPVAYHRASAEDSPAVVGRRTS